MTRRDTRHEGFRLKHATHLFLFHLSSLSLDSSVNSILESRHCRVFFSNYLRVVNISAKYQKWTETEKKGRKKNCCVSQREWEWRQVDEMAVEIESILGSTANRLLSIARNWHFRSFASPVTVEHYRSHRPQRTFSESMRDTTRRDRLILPREAGREEGKCGSAKNGKEYRQRVIIPRIILPFQPPTSPW